MWGRPRSKCPTRPGRNSSVEAGPRSFAELSGPRFSLAARDVRCPRAMKFPLLLALAALLAVPVLHALSPENAIVAAMKLSDAANYSWSTNVDDDARSYAVDAQTD